jgi:hypothetical protein
MQDPLRSENLYSLDYSGIGRWTYPLLFVLGLGESASSISLSDSTLSVRMGWGFSATIPLSSIRSATRDESFVSGIGVHGFGSAWLVNGSLVNVVRLQLAGEGVPARVCGFPLTLRTLRLGVSERDGFLEALQSRRPN